ncbi:hypothetical protein GQ457_18G008280 [Hibiscus cannabinus]
MLLCEGYPCFANAWSANAWSGQFVKGCQAILVSLAASMMLAALLLADSGSAWLWFPSSVPLWCFFVFVILVRPFAEVYPRIVLPLWLCLCGSFHPLSAWCGMHSPPTVACPACVFVQPWARSARLCTANLLGSSSRGGPRTQGCDAKAPYTGWLCAVNQVLSMSLGGSRTPRCDAKASCTDWRMPLALVDMGVLILAPTPLLGVQTSALVSICALGGCCVAYQASLLVVFLCMTCHAPVLALVCSFGPLGFVEPCLLDALLCNHGLVVHGCVMQTCSVLRPVEAPAPRGAMPRPPTLAGACRSRLWPGEFWPLPWLGLLGPTVASLPYCLVCKLPFSGRFVGFALLVSQVSLLFPSPIPTRSPCSGLL